MNTKHSSGKQSDPVTACLKQNAGAKGYKKLQYTQKYHFEPVLWWRSGAKAQVLDHGQVQPAFVSGNIGDVAHPGRIWLFKMKLTLKGNLGPQDSHGWSLWWIYSRVCHELFKISITSFCFATCLRRARFFASSSRAFLPPGSAGPPVWGKG